MASMGDKIVASIILTSLKNGKLVIPGTKRFKINMTTKKPNTLPQCGLTIFLEKER
jgi:hypothetical protein